MFNKPTTPASQTGTTKPLGTTTTQQPVPSIMEQKEKVFAMDKATTVIAQGTSIKGNLKSDESVQLDGSFEGELDIKQTVHVGSGATIKANIKAGEVKISGRVDGNIEAKDRLEIMSSGKLFGDIKTPRLIIAEGVVFEGHCTMGTDKRPESITPSQTVKPITPSSGVSPIR